MTGSRNGFREQFEEHKVEPNSGLGEAMTYMKKHWSKLTLFLRVAGAPLDNNICERSLKKAILHRRNSLFYKTLNGAHVGDIFMSLIHTAELNDVAPFPYLVALLRHEEELAASPSDWCPGTTGKPSITWGRKPARRLEQTPRRRANDAARFAAGRPDPRLDTLAGRHRRCRIWPERRPGWPCGALPFTRPGKSDPVEP